MLSTNFKDIESGTIFEKYSINEILEIEKKLRKEIEKKKEDLRQLVGQRYRELIEAADTITDMKTGIGKVLKSIEELQQLSIHLNATKLHKKSSTKINLVPYYEEGVCVQTLLYSVNQVWCRLDDKEMLNSCRLVIFSNHLLEYLNHSFSLHCPSSDHPFLLSPLLSKQASSLKSLKEILIKRAKKGLMNSGDEEGNSAEKIVEVTKMLACLVLLQPFSIEDALSLLLSCREQFITQCYNNIGTNVKSTLHQLILSIITTIKQLQCLFFDNNDEGGLLVTSLKDVTNKNMKDLFETSQQVWLTLFDNLPAMTQDLQPIKKQQLNIKAKAFVQNWHKQLQIHLEGLLEHITSLRYLSSLKAHLCSTIINNNCSNNWESTCMEVLNEKLLVWEEYLKEQFIIKLKKLVEEEMGLLIKEVKEEIDRMELVTDNQQTDMSLLTWQTNASQKDVKGHTIAIQGLCGIVEMRVAGMLNDLDKYVSIEKSTDDVSEDKREGVDRSVKSKTKNNTRTDNSADKKRRKSNPSNDENLKFDIINDNEQIDDSCITKNYSDVKEVEEILLCVCKTLMENLLLFLEGKASSSHRDLSSDVTMDRMLLYARVAKGIVTLSPSLKKAFDSQSVFTEKTSQFQEKNNWVEIEQKFDEFSLRVYSSCVEHLAFHLCENLSSKLLSNNPLLSFINTATQWEAKEIEEENEEGQLVKSSIKLPVQASAHIHSLLFNLCNNINKIGAHVLPRIVLDKLLSGTLKQALSVYQKYISSTSEPLPALSSSPTLSTPRKMCQNHAIQTWFDLKFLSAMLKVDKKSLKEEEGGESDDGDNEMQHSLQEQLENLIDPFDLDVFKVHLCNNLQFLIHKSSVLYGLVSPSSLSSSQNSSLFISSKHHFTTPMLPSHPRLQLLPTKHLESLSSVPARDDDDDLLTNKQGGNNNHQLRIINTMSSFPSSSSSFSSQPPRIASSSFLEHMSSLFSSNS